MESDAFRRVLSGETTVLLGNRGAGKSAIFQMVARRSRARGIKVIELAPDDYSYEMLCRTMRSEEEGSWAKYGAYAAAWKYTLLVLTMKELCRRQVRSKNASEAAIRKYIREHHHHPDMGTLWALTSYLKRLEGIKIGSYGAQIKTRELERLYKLDEIRHLLPHMQHVFRGMSETFERAELEYIALEIISGDVAVGARARTWLADHDETALIEALWRIGFLEAAVNGGTSASADQAYAAYHRVTSLNVRNVRRFRIHPMFRAYLGTRSSEDVSTP